MKLKNEIKSFIWNSRALFLNPNEELKGKGIILIYHGIVPQNHLKFNYRFINVSDFARQVAQLKNKFNIVSVEDIYTNNLDPRKLNVAITFDDGYKNNFTYAADILNDHHLHASFFITTIRKHGYWYLWPDFLDITSFYAKGNIIIEGMKFEKMGNDFVHNGKTLKNYCRTSPWTFKENMFAALKDYEFCLELPENKAYCELLTEGEIKTLSENKLFTMASHGVYHNNLASIDINEAKSELINSKVYLEKIINKKVDQFAYPDGSYNDELITRAKEVGYHYQLLVSYNRGELGPDNATRERFGVNPFLNPANQIKYIRSGKY